jgi:hypothetical protein
MTAAGTVPYDVVSGAVGVPSLRLSSASGGQVRLARTVRLLGEDFDVTARAKVQTSGTRIRLIPTSVQLADGGPLSGQLSSLIRDRVALDYRIPGLPKGVELRSVSAQPGGFVVNVTGRDLAVSSLQ